MKRRALLATPLMLPAAARAQTWPTRASSCPSCPVAPRTSSPAPRRSGLLSLAGEQRSPLREGVPRATTPESYTRFIRDEIAAYAPLVHEANITPQ